MVVFLSTLTIRSWKTQLFELSKKCFVSNAGISPIKEAVFNAYFVEHVHKNAFHVLFPEKEKVMESRGH